LQSFKRKVFCYIVWSYTVANIITLADIDNNNAFPFIKLAKA